MFQRIHECYSIYMSQSCVNYHGDYMKPLYTGMNNNNNNNNNNNADIQKYNLLFFFSFYYPKCMDG